MTDAAAKASAFRTYLQSGSIVKYAKGQHILRDDDPSHFIYMIKNGLVKIYSINNYGEEFIHIFYGPGEIFPFLWLLGRARQQNVIMEAATDCSLYRVPAEELIGRLQSDVELAFAALQQVTKQFNTYSLRIDNLEFKFASERLAYRLLFIAARFGEQQDGHIALPPIRQRDLAASINISRESVNRELEKFSRKGYLTRDKRCIILLDPAGLKKELRSEINFDGIASTA